MHVRAFPGLAFALILGFCPALQGQSSDLLTAYIQEAFQNSPKLRQSAIAFERQKLALEASRRMFLPEAAFGTTYTLAEGGRNIEFPVGDLMNPVYSTLNVLTQSNSFPQIENVNEQLLPSNFYDARFRIRQPILNAEIEVNKKIQGGQLELKAIEA
nr:TolC family protein [Haliscomenobacter sp.]